MEEQFCNLILTLNRDIPNDTRAKLGQDLLNMLENPESIISLIHILTTQQPETVLKAAALYIYKVLKRFLSQYDQNQFFEIKSLIFQVLQNNPKDSVFQILLSSVHLLYENDSEGWPDLLRFSMDLSNNLNTIYHSAQIFNIISPHIDPSYLTEILPALSTISLNCLKNSSPQIQLEGARLFLKIINISTIFPELHSSFISGSQDHLQCLFNLAQSKQNFTNPEFWQICGAIAHEDIFPPEFIENYSTLALQLASDSQLSAELRQSILDSLIPILSQIPSSSIETLLKISLDIGATRLDPDECNGFPPDLNFLYNSFFKQFSHSDVFPILQSLISSGLSSSDILYQTAALYLFIPLLENAPDLMTSHFSTLSDALETALQSEQKLLICAALRILSSFDEEASLYLPVNTIGPKFAPLVIPLITHPDSEVFNLASAASHSLLSLMDIEIPDLFQQFMALWPSILETLEVDQSENFDHNNIEQQLTRVEQFFQIAPAVLDISGDIDDEQLDVALQLLQDGMEMAPSASLQIGIAIYHKDPDQLSSIIEMEFPIVLQILDSYAKILIKTSQNEEENQNEVNDPNAIKEALIFIGNLSHCFGKESPEILEQFYPSIINIISKLEVSNDMLKQPNYSNIIGEAINVTSSLCKIAPNAFHEHLIPLLTKIFNFSEDGNETDDLDHSHDNSHDNCHDHCHDHCHHHSHELENLMDDLLQVAITSVGKISAILCVSSPEFLHLSTQKIIDIIKSKNQTDEIDIQKLCFKSLTKILKVDQDKIPLNVLSSVTSFVSTIIDPEQANNFLNFSDPIIYEVICLFFANFFRFHTEVADSTCLFLLQWTQRESEYDFANALGALSECVSNSTVSESLIEQILSTTASLISQIENPMSIQNAVYLFNIVAQKSIQSVPTIIKFLPHFQEWGIMGKTEGFGYQDVLSNLASLYLSLERAAPLQIPQELVVTALQEFPPSDALEAMNMCDAILKCFSDFGNEQRIAELPALSEAIVRLICWNEKQLRIAKIPEEIMNALIQLLLQIKDNFPEIVQQAISNNAKSRQKLAKINKIFS